MLKDENERFSTSLSHHIIVLVFELPIVFKMTQRKDGETKPLLPRQTTQDVR